jgi:hypothetical protein
VVSLAWFREFNRVRRCLPPSPRRPQTRVPVKFVLRVGDVAGVSATSSVEVAGSFNDWKVRIPCSFRSAVNGGDRFESVMQLAPGAYTYKFVVDGTLWTTTPEAPVTSDGAGFCE